MRELFEQRISEENYVADTCIVWCSDDRFWPMLDRFITGMEFAHPDVISVVGGAKDLATPHDEAARLYLLRQIKKAIRLHGTPEVHLMVHMGCGGYALHGLEFRHTHQELDFLEKEVNQAAEVVREFLKQDGITVIVRKYIATFDGLFEV